MSRLRQINSQNYYSAGAINDEFESLIRYLNAAETGNKTVGELMNILFDEEGNFDANVELRLDTANGLQYRVGTYLSPETGWITIAAIDSLRGATGIDYGLIGEPIFRNRYDFVAAGGETEFDVPHDIDTTFMVYINGLLQLEGAGGSYTASTTGGTNSTGSITFSPALIASDKITIYLIQDALDFSYVRVDTVTSTTQANFGFPHTDADSIQVYKNGLLLKQGVSDDYYLDTPNDLVILTAAVPASTIISIIKVSPTGNRTVVGLMTEANYTNLDGYIPFSKLVFADNEIPKLKVEGLVDRLAVTPDITIGGATPVPPTRFWLDQSTLPSQLKFYDGSVYLSANPASAIPDFTSENAAQFLAVDPTGTVLEYANVDLSSLIPKTQRSSANGVAALDSSARLPASQLPDVVAYYTLDYYEAGAVTDATRRVGRYYKQEVSLYAIDLRVDGGSCDVQIDVDGVLLGDVYAVTVSPTTALISPPITLDTSLASKRVSLVISNSIAPTNLDVAISVQIKSQ